MGEGRGGGHFLKAHMDRLSKYAYQLLLETLLRCKVPFLARLHQVILFYPCINLSSPPGIGHADKRASRTGNLAHIFGTE